MPDDSISDEDFNDIMSQMKTGVSPQGQNNRNRGQKQNKRDAQSDRDLFGGRRGSESSWERQMEDKISELDSRRDQNVGKTSRQNRGQSRRQGDDFQQTGRQGGDKLERAINMVVQDLKDKGYTDDFISNNREIIRSKVKDYMQ